MKRNHLVGDICCWMLFSACAITASAADYTVDLPLARPTAVAYSPDGKQMAVGGLGSFGDVPNDGVVLLVDAATGTRQSLLRHSGTIKDKDGRGSSSTQNRILALAYSPDGKTLAVASVLGLKLWGPTDGKELATLLGYGIDDMNRQVEVTSVAFSRDGKLLAVARSPIELWDVIAQKPLRQMEMHGDTHVTFAKDGSLLASASYQNEVHLWNVADGKELGRVHAEMGPLYGLALDPQDKVIAAVGEGGEKLWRMEMDAAGDWKFVDEVRLGGHFMSAVRQVAFSPDGRWLATSGYDGSLVLYDASTQQIIGTLLAGGPFAFSPDGKSMAVAQFRDDRRSSTRPPGTQPKGGTRLTVWKVDDLLNANRLSEQARAAAAEMVQTMTAARPDRRLIQGVIAVLSGPQAEAATPTLVDALANPAVNEKNLLLFPLGRIAGHDAKARTALIEALRSNPEVDVRSMAAGMLTELPKDAGKEAVPALVEAALNDESPRVSSEVARTLQRLDPAAYKTVTEKLQARGPVVAKVERRDGKLFYQGRSLEEWIKRLSVSYIPNEIFGRPRPNEPLAAIRAIGADAVPVLVDTLKSDEWPLRQAAAAGLETLGLPAASAIDPLLAIISAAKDDDLTMAVASASAVAAILKPANEPPAKLLAMLNSEKPATRLGAACAVAQIQPNHARAIQTLKAALESSQRRRDWRFDVHRVGAFTPQPTLEWLTRTLADPETPRDKRIQAVATLSQLGEEALPALLAVIGENDELLTHEADLAIQRIGPKSIPAVRDALTAATSDRTRKRLSSTLWGIGEEGRRTLTEVLTKDDAESLWWWAALTSHVGDPVAMQYQMAASETLQKLGHAVAPPTLQPGAPQAQGTANVPGPAPFAKPNAKWLVKTLTDGDIPKQLRVQVSSELERVPIEEVLPELPTLLSAIGQDDPGIGYPIQKVVMRLGSQAVPAVRDALLKAGSDDERRRLLSTLHGLGDEGRRAAQEMVKNDRALQQLLSSKSKPARGSEAVTREISRDERAAIAAAERTDRPLTNGNFQHGLEGWIVEGGASSFGTFPRGEGRALTTFGEHQDADTGRLFQCFRVPEDASKLTFKLHGGANRKKTWVALWRKNDRHGQVAARNDNTPFQTHFLLTPLRGEVVTLEIVDNNTDGWGFIGVEDFHIEQTNGTTAQPGPVHEVTPPERPVGSPFAPKGQLTHVDLQPKCNQKLAENMHYGGPGENTLAELPTGDQMLAGVRFRIGEGLIHLASTAVPDLPEKITGIEVNQRFNNLYLLQGMGFAQQLGFKKGATIGTYVMHYEDETTEAIPMVYGEDVRDWWNVDRSQPVSRGFVAWEGNNAATRQFGTTLRLYATKWTNPHPEKLVTSIDFISDNTTAAAPFCVAMTLEAEANDVE
jgi:HEAT repeat protein